jgi:FKBP-type peptidyl-prolyl cis-trans isomerase
MKFATLGAVGLGLAVMAAVAVGQDEKKAPDAPKDAAPAASKLTDQKSKVSYAIGTLMGRNLKGQSVDVDTEVLIQGIRDALSGGKPLLTDAEIQETLRTFQQQLVTEQVEKSKKAKQDGETFLAQNKAKPGVRTLPSGLQYKVIKEGTGKTPTANDTVVANYRGTLIDGTEFDSSYKRGEPASFPVNGVIRGWTEALQMMKVGSKWQLFIPSDLAYGASPRPGSGIPPYSALVFEVELVGIK